jgi:hypothetical protein
MNDDNASTEPAQHDDERTRRLWPLLLGVLVAGIAVGVAVVLLVTNDDDDSSKAAASNHLVTTSTSAGPTTAAPTTTLAPSTAAGPPSAASGGAGTGGGGTGGSTATTVPTTTAPSGPVITSFTASTDTLACPDPSVTFQTTPSVTLSWTTQNATTVQLLVNGGLYGNYGAQGQETLTPGCPSAGGSQTYTYTLKAIGSNGQSASKDVKVQVTA